MRSPLQTRERPIKVHNFTQQHPPDFFCGFDKGDALASHFSIRGPVVSLRDELLLKMNSGKIGRFRVYSLHRVHTEVPTYHAIGELIGYASLPRK